MRTERPHVAGRVIWRCSAAAETLEVPDRGLKKLAFMAVVMNAGRIQPRMESEAKAP
jgi:hypothetical protein